MIKSKFNKTDDLINVQSCKKFSRHIHVIIDIQLYTFIAFVYDDMINIQFTSSF